VQVLKQLLELQSNHNVLIVCGGLIQVKWSRYRPCVAQRVGRRIALLFHDRDTRRGWVIGSTPRLHFTPGKDPVPILQEAGCAPGPGWTGAENLVPTGIPSRTVQPVVSRHTDWATRPTGGLIYSQLYSQLFPLRIWTMICEVPSTKDIFEKLRGQQGLRFDILRCNIYTSTQLLIRPRLLQIVYAATWEIS
jgi:hypothetical protein